MTGTPADGSVAANQGIELRPEQGEAAQGDPEQKGGSDRVPASAVAGRIPSLEARRTAVVFVIGSALVAVALTALYTGPTYGRWFGLRTELEKRDCIIGVLCEREILTHNHLGVAALIGAIVAWAIGFSRTSAGMGRSGASHQGTVGDDGGSGIARNSLWFGVASVLVVGYEAYQAATGDAPGRGLWIGGLALAALVATMTDRGAGRSLARELAPVMFAAGLVVLLLGLVGLRHRLVLAVLLLIGGLALILLADHLGACGRGSLLRRVDALAIVVLALLTLGLGAIDIGSARYAFIGDEWTFYSTAVQMVRGEPTLSTFEIGGPNDYFTGATFQLQAAVMWLAGDDAVGWRLSALLPIVLAVPAVYAFVLWLAGRRAAIVAGGVVASSHVLLTFGKVAYNNSQAIVPMTAGLAAFALAARRRSVSRLLLLGMVLGTSFLVYALARLVLLPAGLLFLGFVAAGWRRFMRDLGWVVAGFVVTAAPALFSIDNWRALMKATPAQPEDVVAESGVGRQMLENLSEGLLLPIANTQDTHFIVGPHLDVISVVLLVAGLAYLVARIGRDGNSRAWLVGAMAMWLLVVVMQQYERVTNTRSFLLVPTYAVFAGVGFAALTMSLRRRWSRWPVYGLAAGLVGVLVAVNLAHVQHHSNERHQLTPEAMLAMEFERGAEAPTHVVWDTGDRRVLETVLAAHGVGPGSVDFLRSDEVQEAGLLCAGAELRVILALRDPEWQAVTQQASSCRDDVRVEHLADPAGGDTIVRMTAAASSTTAEPAGGTARVVGRLEVEDVFDVEVREDGVIVAVRRVGSASELVWVRPDGFVLDRRSVDTPAVVDLTLLPDGELLLVSADGAHLLTWLDADGAALRTRSADEALAGVGGATQLADGRVVVTDVVTGDIVALDEDGNPAAVLVSGLAARPGSLAATPEGGLWVHTGGEGELLLLSAVGEIVVRLAVSPYDALDPPRLSATADGGVVMPDPNDATVRRYSADGTLVEARGLYESPRAATISAEGSFIVVTRSLLLVNASGT